MDNDAKKQAEVPLSLRREGSPLSETLGRIAVERERPWAECGIEEKVERLRGVLDDLRHHIHWVGRTVSRLDRRFHDHEHGQRGQIVISANRHDHDGEGIAASAHDPLR